jgi:molybdopterin-guanine dinucleotide biosynthesis protein MobB
MIVSPDFKNKVIHELPGDYFRLFMKTGRFLWYRETTIPIRNRQVGMMRVVNVTGYSGSGKTTFILQLISELSKSGPTATIKHIGHHHVTLEPGKDTTLFHNGGASVSAGIDSEKSVYITGNHDFRETLDYLCDYGVVFAIIEGYKLLDLPSVVIGDLVSDHALFRNPDPMTVVRNIDAFPEYDTKNSLERVIKQQWNALSLDFPLDQAVFATVTNEIDLNRESEIPGAGTFYAIAAEVTRELSRVEKNATGAIAFRNWWLFGGPKELYCSSAAPDYNAAFQHIIRGVALLKERFLEEGVIITIKGWQDSL